MLSQTDIEQLIDVVMRSIELFQLLKDLDTLHLFQLAASYMQHSHVLERAAKVSETFHNGIVELQVLETWQNFSSYLQTVARSVHSKFKLRQQGKFAHINTSESHSQEFLVQIDHIFDLLVVHDLHEVVLHIGQSHWIMTRLGHPR